jgi:IS4 transposase
VGAWVRGCLLLFDLGYYSFHLFDRIDRNGGYFLTRLKSNANPLILRANRRWRGASIPVLGAHLQDVLGSLKRQVLDVQVLVRFRRRTYRDRRSVGQQPLRLVALRDPDSPRYHCFLTNVPTRRLRAEDIARTYALRWQVEILFKAMKHHGHLDQLPSEKKCVVDCLIWASLLAVMVSQTLRRLILRMLPKTRFVPLLRWAALFARIANALLRVVLAPDPEADTQLLRLLIQDAPDPNLRRRDRALARVVAAHAT